MTDTDPYRIRSPETWDAACEAYLNGATAEEVCERFDLGLSAFRARARREGWRRADQPDPADTDDADDEALDDADPARLARMAWRHVAHALVKGRSAEAQRWLRVHAQLSAAEQAREREQEAVNDVDPIAAFRAAADARAIERMARHMSLDPARLERLCASVNVHDVHPDSSTASEPPAPPSEPRNRAERRRLARSRDQNAHGP